METDTGAAIQEVESRLYEVKPDALVLGLGPSAHLLPKVDPSLLEGVRLYGVNDVFDIMPVHEVVVMDPPRGPLDPKKNRHAAIVSCDPERLWLYTKRCHDEWMQILPKRTREKVTRYDLHLLPPHREGLNRKPDLNHHPVTHTVSSPCGTTCIAWQAGYRKIGVIGVDLLPSKPRLANLRSPVTWFFSCISYQAWQLGGRIFTLSPETKGKFWKPPWPRETPEQEEFAKAWTRGKTVESPIPEYMRPFTSLSAPTGGSTAPEPRPPWSAVSLPTRPFPLPSTG